MSLSFLEYAALSALAAVMDTYPDADEDELAERAFDMAAALDAERRKRRFPVPAVSFSAGDSDLALDGDADASLGPIVEIETDVLTRNEHRSSDPPAETGWKEFHDSLKERKAGDTSPVVKGRKP